MSNTNANLSHTKVNNKFVHRRDGQSSRETWKSKNNKCTQQTFGHYLIKSGDMHPNKNRGYSLRKTNHDHHIDEIMTDWWEIIFHFRILFSRSYTHTSTTGLFVFDTKNQINIFKYQSQLALSVQINKKIIIINWSEIKEIGINFEIDLIKLNL